MQLEDSWYTEVKEGIEGGVVTAPKYVGYIIDNDGLMRYNQCVYISTNEEV